MERAEVPLPRQQGASLLSQTEDRWVTAMLLMAVAFSLLPAGLEWISYEDFAGQAKSGSWRFQAQWLAVFGIAYGVIFRHAGRALETLRAANPFLLLMVAYTVLNAMWSLEPVISLKRVFQLAGIVAIGVAFQMTGRPMSYFLRVVLWAISGILLASAVIVVVSPSIGIDSYFGSAWRGVLATKNDLGYVGGLAVVLWVVAADLRVYRWPVVLAGLGLAVLCMLAATSSTGIATALLGLAVFAVLRRHYIGSTLWLARIMVSIALVGLVMVQVFFIMEARLPLWSELIGPLAASFGKSSDLTGRTEIWAGVFEQFQKHPLGGIGWGAFWLGPGSASQPVLDQLPWIPFQAHNGYLDILNELGLVGMLIFLAMLLAHAVQLSRLSRVDATYAALHSTMLVLVLFTNFSESSLYKAVAFPHILLILSSLAVSTQLFRLRRPIPLARPAPARPSARVKSGQPNAR